MKPKQRKQLSDEEAYKKGALLPEPLRELPKSLDAEMGVLSSILLNSQAVMQEVSERVSKDCFFDPILAQIFEVILDMWQEERKIDLITLTQRLRDFNLLDDVGGVVKITEIATFLNTHLNFREYISIVREKKLLRQLILYCQKTQLKLWDEQANLTAALINATKELSEEIAASISFLQSGNPSDLDQELLMGYVDTLEAITKGGVNKNLRTTPFHTINEKAGGTLCGEVTAITGRPSSGKSIWGKQWLKHCLFEYTMPSLVLTGEMPYQQWMNRLVAEVGEIPFKAIRNGQFDKGQLQRMSNTIDRISKMPLYVYDRKRCNFKASMVEAIIRREVKQRGVQFLLIDYLQLITADGKKEQRTDQDIGDVAKVIKGLTVEYGLHTVVLCSESEEGNIRNSREPEYDFDNIIKLVVRQEKHPKNDSPMIITDRAICSKWRDAERGYMMRVEMEGQYCRFKDVSGPNT